MEKFKKVLERKELYIQLSEDEMQELGWKEGQKLSFKFNEKTKAISIEPWVKVELDMSQWPIELLEFLIKESCDKDVSVNEIINEVLSKFCYKNNEESL